MDLAQRSFVNAEREKINRLSRTINEKSMEFLREPHSFEYLAVRGYVNFIDDGAELARSIDPATLALDLTPGIFEGALDLRQHRSHADNPFDRLVDQACFVISEGLRRDPKEDRVFVFQGGTAGMEFNMRLGKSLWAWAEGTGSEAWAAVGRSLVLSVLSMADGSGTVASGLTLSETGEISGAANQPRISTARLHRILQPGEYYPRAASIGSGVSGIWAWTAASSISAAQENNVLDISVSFPVGETHYMMIRGVRPFAKIQIYNIDYRTYPQFERYDSSGWVYQGADQILILKMKHRSQTEHIRIFY
jgi:hypothetical protein